MIKRGSQFLFFTLIITSLILAACGGANQNQSQLTPDVPVTGLTPDVPVTGLTPTMDTGAGALATPTLGDTTVDPVTTPTVDTGAGVAQPTATVATGAQTTPTTGTGGTWQGEQIGGTVTVLAIWGGEELESFREMIRPFEEQTGISVQYEGTRDLGAVLNTRVQGGNPPDLAGLPNPGQLVALAEAGSLLPLNDVLDMDVMNQWYDPGFLDLATVDGQMYGIWTKAAVKSLVWYNPKQFDERGYQVPTSYEELQALEQQMIADGFAPWCIGIDGGAGSGWPGTDWIEDIVLHQFGPDYYDQWVNHEVPWTDGNVRQAFETWGQWVTDPQMAYGGPQYVIATNFGQAFSPMFQEPPQCFLHRQASFITTFFQEQYPDLVAGEDYDFFMFPGIDPQYEGTLLVAGDLFGMFNDTPQARALLQYLVTADAQQIWAERGGFISANRTVDPSVYPDQISQQIGGLIAEATAVRFDASDLMPEAVNNAFSQAVLNYVQSPNQLDGILEQVESTAAGAYSQ